MNNINFKEVAVLWCDDKRKYVKRSTIATYSLTLSNHLLPYFGDSTDISEHSVQEFALAKLAAGLSQKTIKDMLIVLMMITKFGYKHRIFPLCEWDVKFPTEQKSDKLPVFSLYDQRKLMKYLAANFTFRNLGIFICLNTGMRIGEICGLRWSDIDLHQEVLTINRTVERIYINSREEKKTEIIISTPKTTNSHREIPLTKTLLKILKPLKAIVNADFYVLSNDTTPIEPRTYRNYYKHLLEALGIPPIKFHGLRHSFATRCIESNCDYKTVSTILGHSNISTTLDLYVHPNKEQKKRCIDKMLKSLGSF